MCEKSHILFSYALYETIKNVCRPARNRNAPTVKNRSTHEKNACDGQTENIKKAIRCRLKTSDVCLDAVHRPGYNVIMLCDPVPAHCPPLTRIFAMALHIVDHPLIRHKLGLLRKESTSTSEFRMLAKEVARLLTYEATKNLPTEKKMVKGWAGQVEVDYLAGKMITIVPILRAGLGLMDGVLDMVPGAKISVLGMYRNEETLEPVEYYKKLARRIDQRVAFILDPMLATGGSLIAAIDVLKKNGCRQICSLNLVAAPEGVKAVLDKHPDVEIYAAALDSHLNENGYIIPGLGDAGDRIFGTR